MPIYEYECEKCGHQKEAIQKISDDPLKTCPECKQDSLRKLVSAAGFRLSGTGWYETDFKDKKDQKKLHVSDSKPPASESKGSDSAPGESKASSKSDSSDSAKPAKPAKAAASKD